MIDRRQILAFPLLALLPTGTAFAAAGRVQAPRIKIKSIDQLPRPLPAPYDARRDGNAQVEAGLKVARRAKKPLLIDFGANWCADCRVLAGVLELPEMKPWVAKHFELIQVDVGEFDRNLDIPRRFSGKDLDAVPAIFVIDPKTGKLRNPDSTLALGDARVMRPQAIADWLASWTI